MAEFKKCKRDAKLLLDGQWLNWRLASVDEVNENRAKIRASGILNSWDTVRLLDGCVEKYKGLKQYRPNMEDMILVKTDISRTKDGSFASDMYSKVKLFTKGGKAALLLACEDKITEAICFVLHSMSEVKKEKGDSGMPQKDIHNLKKCMKEEFDNGTKVLHSAVDQPYNKSHPIDVVRFVKKIWKDGEEMIKAADIYGRTALHFAALRGNTELCSVLIEECKMKVDKTDINKENVLDFAIKGKQKAVFESLCALSEVQSIIGSQDAQGKTALHKAAAQGSKEMIETLLLNISKSNDKQKYISQAKSLGQPDQEISREEKLCLGFIQQADLFGQTPLLEAARGGHVEALQLLLRKGSNPLLERNSDGRTALHYAAQLSNQTDAKNMARLLLEHFESNKERSLLLWASATGSGTAEAASPKSSSIKKYLKKVREKTAQSSKDLLSSAVELGHEKMAWELVTRCANTTHTAQIAKCTCRSENQLRAKNLIDQLNKIEKMPEQGRDQPAIYDSLGRKEFAQGLAELFLNPYVKSPLTVGISGEWGMGKSSLMIQTESILLKTAAQLAFPNFLATEQFPGCRQIKQTPEGRRKYEEMNKTVKNLVQSSASNDCPLLHFLEGDYQEEHRDIYKSLALMDRSEMFEMKPKDEAADWSSKEHPLRKIPTILTVRYNAWHYQDQSEAWAGLAVEITKAIEESMTTAQRVRCHWRYAWRKQRNKIWLELFLPFLLALFLASWVALVVWKLISRSKNNELVQLTYGSIPITILVIFWSAMRQFFSLIKPVSVQIMGYFSKPDHTTKLGYQHQVIFDISFLKEEIGEKPSLKWKLVGCICNLLHLYPEYSDTVKGTSIPKSPAPGKDGIRMIVFVDDLDRCEDSIILKVLSAVNLVLAACNINVILGMDQKMIERAMKCIFPDTKDEEELKDLAKKYISKMVQLPLALPDTSEDETKKFLRERLGQSFQCSSQNVEAKVPEQASTKESASDNQPLAGQSRDHVCLEVRDNVAEKRQIFFSKLSQKFKSFGRFKNCLLWGPEETKGKRKKRKLRTMSLNFQRFIPNYSDEERKALDDLSEAATGERKLPREWKRFLTYHRVAWNILSQSEKVKKTPGWQMQLVVWLFCCWQWEHQINDITKDWNKLVKGFFADGDDSLESNKPSLSNIIEHYRPPLEDGEDEDEDEGKKTTEDTKEQEKEPEPVPAASQKQRKKQGSRTAQKQELELKQGLDAVQKKEDEEKEKQELELKHKQELELKKKQGLDAVQKKEDEEKEKKGKSDNWYSLRKTLIKYRYDVSLDCILSFQKFRLHCDIGHLSSPKNNGSRKDKASN